MRFHYIYCLICLLGLLSCSEEVNFDPYHQQKVVVNCILTPGYTQKLTLTYNNHLKDFYFEKITDATVSLYAGDELIGNFEPSDYGDWEMTYTPVSGQHYKLKVEIPDMPTIEGSTTMPFNVPVIKDKEGNETFVRKFFIQDMYEAPYWVFVMNKRDEKDAISSKDRLMNSLGTNHEACDRFNLSGAGMSTLIGQDAKTQEQLIYLRIMPNGNEVYNFCVEAQVNDSWFYFRAASEEYDRYLKTSFQKMLVYQAFDDPSQWFDESTVYSNVNNGLGIFGAYSDVIMKYQMNLWEPIP